MSETSARLSNTQKSWKLQQMQETEYNKQPPGFTWRNITQVPIHWISGQRSIYLTEMTVLPQIEQFMQQLQ